MKRARLLVCLSMAVGLLAMFGQSSSAGADGVDNYYVGYYNLGPNVPLSSAGDNTLRIINPGTAEGANLCANIYLFDSSQHMQACCSCYVSADGMLALSVQNLVGSSSRVRSGVIKVVSGSVANGCSATTVTPANELRGWIAHFSGGALSPSLSEEELLRADLSDTELKNLQSECNSRNVTSCSRSCPAENPPE